MVFSSYIFLFLFLPVVCLVYFILPFRLKNYWLLLSSLFFYSWTAPKFTLVLLASMVINYTTGLLLSKAAHRKTVLTAGIALNLALLLYFKYANFIVANLALIKPSLAENWSAVTLPLGISFFTFQGMSYIIDVYRGDGETLKNPAELGLYISLFPQLVAGPIVRFKSIAAEIHDRSVTMDLAGYGFRRFTYGLSKKILLANTFGMMADAIFGMNAADWNYGRNWIGILAYTLQIYYDFSGYSDMAIGLGAIFGFHFDENFRYPYISRSITEFWRRWHISLSSWFRDYVYIPLGGSRVKARRHIFNIMVVWLLTGFWHGANWTFLCWGIYYGVLLIIEKYLSGKIMERLFRPVRWLITFLLVMVGWVFFRSDSVFLAIEYLKKMLDFSNTYESNIYMLRYLTNYKWFWAAGLIGMFPIIPFIEKKMTAGPVAVKALYAVLDNLWIALLFVISVLFLISGSYNAFIYFQF